MKKAVQKAGISYFFKLMICLGMLVGITKAVFRGVKRYENKMGINMDTYHIYCRSIWIMLGVVVCLLIIWHLLAHCECKIRESFEQLTWMYVIAFCIVCFSVSAALFLRYPGIERTNESVIRLSYVFCYPCVFGFALFCAAPSNICKVIIPYNNWFRWIIGGAFAAASYIILIA